MCIPLYTYKILQMRVVLLVTPCKRGLCPPQSLVDRAIFTVGAVGAGGKAVSWRGSCCSCGKKCILS